MMSQLSSKLGRQQSQNQTTTKTFLFFVRSKANDTTINNDLGKSGWNEHSQDTLSTSWSTLLFCQILITELQESSREGSSGSGEEQEGPKVIHFAREKARTNSESQLQYQLFPCCDLYLQASKIPFLFLESLSSFILDAIT